MSWRQQYNSAEDCSVFESALISTLFFSKTPQPAGGSFSLTPFSRVLCASISSQAQIQAQAAIYQSTLIRKLQVHVTIRTLLRRSASQRDRQLVRQPPSRCSVNLQGLFSKECTRFEDRNVVSAPVKEQLDPYPKATIHKVSSSGTKSSG